MQVDDKSLLRLLADDKTQRRAFEIIVSQYSEMLYRQIRRIVLFHDDANDVLQNTFMKAWQAVPMFEGRSKISSWLYRIAINEALDFRRRRREELSLEDSNTEMGVAAKLMADTYFEGDRAEAMLHQAIDELPDVQRTVFQLRYFEEMKFSEISAITGTTEGALKASYHIAVKKIQTILSKQD